MHRARYVGPSGGKPAEELNGKEGLDRALDPGAPASAGASLVPDENVLVERSPRSPQRSGSCASTGSTSCSRPRPRPRCTSSARRSSARRAPAGSPTCATRSIAHAHRRSESDGRAGEGRCTDGSRGSSPRTPTRSPASRRRSPTRCAALEPRGRRRHDPERLRLRRLRRARATRPADRFRITHTGSFFGKRDPRPFLQALARLGARRPARASSATSASADREWAAELGLGDRLELIPYAPRADVARAPARLGGAAAPDPRRRRAGQGRALGQGVRVHRGRASDPGGRPAGRRRRRADPRDRGGRRRRARRRRRDPRRARRSSTRAGPPTTCRTSRSRTSGATGSPAGRASRRPPPCSAATDGRTMRGR